MTSAEIVASAEKQGPCFLCGPPTLARHRVWDSIDKEASAPGAFSCHDFKIAQNYDSTVEEVRWVRRQYRAARKAHAPLPGRPGWRVR